MILEAPWPLALEARGGCAWFSWDRCGIDLDNDAHVHVTGEVSCVQLPR